MEANLAKNLTDILNTAIRVIAKPTGFYRGMEKTGGFSKPLIFAVILGLVSGVITAILSIFSLGSAASFAMGIASIIIYPIMIAIFGFVGAAILYIIWKIMGSPESYETAYRCGAYSMAIVPVTTLLGIIPYLGTIIAIIWGLYLMIVASTKVHKIPQKTAFIVFGVLCGLLVIMSTCSQYAGRKLQNEMEGFGTKMEDFGSEMEEMTPEEAGKALGEFMKGLQDATEESE